MTSLHFRSILLILIVFSVATTIKSDDTSLLIEVSAPEGVYLYPKELYQIKEEDFTFSFGEILSMAYGSGDSSGSGNPPNYTNHISDCRVEYYAFDGEVRTVPEVRLFDVVVKPKPIPTTAASTTEQATTITNTTEAQTTGETTQFSTALVTSPAPLTSAYNAVGTSEDTFLRLKRALASKESGKNDEKTSADYDFFLVQVHDLDREERDQYTLTLVCTVDGMYGIAPETRWASLKVTDINDNTPMFDPTSLSSIVTTNITVGSPILKLRATDPDLGVNSELRFEIIQGSVRRKLPNETKSVGGLSVPSLLVFSTGDVISYGILDQEMDIYFKVVVKDRGNRATGNRATATATISVVLPGSSVTPSPIHQQLQWWVIVIIATISIIFLVLLLFILYKYLRRKGLVGFLMLRVNENNDEDRTDLPTAGNVLLDNETSHENDRV